MKEKRILGIGILLSSIPWEHGRHAEFRGRREGLSSHCMSDWSNSVATRVFAWI